MKADDWVLQPRHCVCASLRKVTRSVTQLFDNALRPSGLRTTQFNILAEIKGAGEATVTGLARSLLIDQTTLTRSLALLERDGLLSSVPKPDARVRSLRLTKKGDRAFAEAVPLWSAAQKKIIGRIGKDVWESLSTELDGLARDSAQGV